MQTAVVAADRLGEILDLEAEKGESDERRKLHPESIAGDVELKNIDFRYGTRKLVLEGVKSDDQERGKSCVSSARAARGRPPWQSCSSISIRRRAARS